MKPYFFNILHPIVKFRKKKKGIIKSSNVTGGYHLKNVGKYYFR